MSLSNLDKIYENVSKDFTSIKFAESVFFFIDKSLKNVLIELQKDQLFNDSIGADGVKLGYYRRAKKRARSRAKGEQYDMVFTGFLKNSIRVIISRGEIVFKADNEYMYTIRFRDFFGTDDWFGLTEENLDYFIENYLAGGTVSRKNEIVGSVTKKIFTGNW